MASPSDLLDISDRTVRQALPGIDVEGVNVDEAVDSEGREIIKVGVILDEASADRINAGHLITILKGLRHAYGAVGEERLPSADFIVPSEMIEDGDPQP